MTTLMSRLRCSEAGDDVTRRREFLVLVRDSDGADRRIRC